MNTKEDYEYKDITVELLQDIKNNLKSMRVKQGWTIKLIGSIFHSNKPLRYKLKYKDQRKIHVLSIIVIMKEIVLNLIYYYIIYILVVCEYSRESDLSSINLAKLNLPLLICFCLWCSIENMVKNGGTFRLDC